MHSTGGVGTTRNLVSSLTNVGLGTTRYMDTWITDPRTVAMPSPKAVIAFRESELFIEVRAPA